MITLATVAAFLSKYGLPLIDLLKKYWKEISVGGLIVWVVICSMSHCGSPRPGEPKREVTIEVDTFWVYPDTNAIFALHGFDTLPKYVQELENRFRFKPKAPVIRGASNTSDSLNAYVQLLEEANIDIAICDSMYGDAVAVRTYSDSLVNDSIVINLEIKTSGRLIEEPRLSYRNTAPYPVVEKRITIKETVHVGPFRKIYLGAAIGPRILWKENEYSTIVGSPSVGYSDKKNWTYELQGDFTDKDYTVKFGIKKSFNVGR